MKKLIQRKRPTAPNLDRLEALADELLQAEPREGIVRQFMTEAGLSYTKDPVARLEQVISALNLARSSETSFSEIEA